MLFYKIYGTIEYSQNSVDMSVIITETDAQRPTIYEEGEFVNFSSN